MGRDYERKKTMEKMYTYCLLQFVDGGESFEAIIKADEEVVPEVDDLIFFYGMSREELISACNEEKVCEGEWKVLEVYESVSEL